MRRYQKYYGKAFFPLVWNFDHENFSSSHLVIPGKIQYLDISFLAAGPLIRYSALKIWTVSNISLGRGCLLYKRDLRKAYRVSSPSIRTTIICSDIHGAVNTTLIQF